MGFTLGLICGGLLAIALIIAALIIAVIALLARPAKDFEW